MRALTELVIVRHGETEDNAAQRWQGHLPGVLSPRGRMQAAALGRRLRGMALAALYASDLARAQDTARIIAAETGHELVLDARLRERNFGVFQGLNAAQIQEKFPSAWEAHKRGDPRFVVPQGESALAHAERAVECLEELVHQHSGRRIAVVTHGGVLNALLRRVLAIPWSVPRSFSLENAAFNRFDFDLEQARWMLRTWGDSSHL